MRNALTLAAIPALVWGVWPAPTPDPELVAKVVQTENITARRSDLETFASRWRPVYLAPMRNEVRAIRGLVATNSEKPAPLTTDLFAPAVYRTEPVRGGDAQPAENASKPVEAARSPPPARLVRRAGLRVNGICARHGLRTVHYGRRWRCRK